MAEQYQEDPVQPLSIGERIRQAREAKGLSLEDVASQTRIPVRHLQNIDEEHWDALPAATYCIGFVRSYANAVGLDGAELGRELRDRLGGTRTRAPAPEYFEPADQARVPPRWLAIAAALIAVVLIAGYAIWRSSLDDAPDAPAAAEAPSEQPKAPTERSDRPVQPQSLAGQPVTLTATGPVWLRLYEEGGRTIVERTLAAGESLQVPATASRPMLRVGAPESLRVTVGTTQVPQLGPAGQPVGNVSLRPEDLAARMEGGAAPVPTTPLPAPIPPQ